MLKYTDKGNLKSGFIIAQFHDGCHYTRTVRMLVVLNEKSGVKVMNTSAQPAYCFFTQCKVPVNAIVSPIVRVSILTSNKLI